jgi:16S rRNA processing protein RimM
LTDQPRFQPGKRVVLDDGTPLVVSSSTPYKGRLLVSFEEIADRTAAERLRHRSIGISREEIGEPPEGAVWAADLEGLPVLTADGAAVGTVVMVEPNPAHDLLVVRDASDREFHVPMVSEFVDPVEPGVDHVTIHPIPGLLPE